jgi:cyclopropane fatty-acyl-phospholipid synthase-like methyltransferase
MLDANEKTRLEWSMGFPGQWEEHRRFQIDFLRKNGLLPHHSLMEIGCGPLTGGVPIIDYLDQDKYVGVDVRASVLNMSWKEVSKAELAGKNPRLIQSTSFGDNALGDMRFDYVLTFSVLYHLSDELLDACFKAVANRLKPAGTYFANINTETNSDRWLEFPFLKRTLGDYEAVAAKAGLKITELGTLADLGFKLPGEERLNRMLRIVPFEQ